MSTKLPNDFKPTEQSYSNLRKHGVLPDFIDDQLPGFITYWQETGKKKSSWQMTLQTWMRRAHQGGAGREWEEKRHIREKHGKPKADLFADALRGLEFHSNGEMEIEKNKTYRMPLPPDPGPAMSFEQAREELKKMKII